MPLICEICGKEIIPPNYIESSFQGMHENFYECARCNLDSSIDRYMEFKDVKYLEFHTSQLERINSLNFTFLSFK